MEKLSSRDHATCLLMITNFPPLKQSFTPIGAFENGRGRGELERSGGLRRGIVSKRVFAI